MAKMTLVQQAVSILDTFRVSLKDRRVLADEATVVSRLEVCESCPYLKEKKGKLHCVKCGCGYKRKVAYHGASCPLEKW